MRTLVLSIITIALFAAFANAQPSDPDSVREITVSGSTVRATVWPEADGTGFSIDLGDGTTSPPTKADYRLLLRHGAFDPLVDTPRIDPLLTAQDDNRLFIVQYWTQALEAYRTAIRTAGAEPLFYLPNYADVIAMAADQTAVVTALPFVRSVTPFHPAFRMEAELRQRIALNPVGWIKINLLTSRRGLVAQRPVMDWVRIRGGFVDHVSEPTFLMTLRLPVALLPELAALEHVQWIDRWTAPEEDMNIARSFHGADYVETVAGATGQGVRVEVMDGGCETIHPDLQNFGVHSPTNTPSNHGTATSGIVCGSGAGNASARGCMPNAFLAIGDYSSFAGGSRYSHSAELVNPSLSWQCVLQSNSWGGGRTRSYTSTSQNLDLILFDFENLSILQSQSNAGNQDSRPEAWAKNIISVGGVRHFNTSTKSDDSWSGGASIGPAADGRIKPDLASFYDNILTTDRVGSAGYSSTNYTSTFGGTSGATPIVAGHLGLFYQLWDQGIFGNSTPGPTVFANAPKNTTAKAVLINTASQWSFSGTSSDLTRVHQGWGHPDLQNLYDSRTQMVIVDESDVLTNLQSKTYSINVAPGTSALKVTLVYRDPPGTVSASQHRINNLDLRVVSPGSTTYHGNNGLLGSQWSTAGGSPNTVDTVENVFVQSPATGTWQVTVTAAELNQDSHPETGGIDADYALVVSGGTQQTGPQPPAAPSNLTATLNGTDRIDLAWNDNASDEDGFRLERSVSGGSFSLLASLGANATSYSDLGLAAGTTFAYRVRAFNANGDSAWSNTASETTPTPSIDYLATAETPDTGTVSGNYTATHAADLTYQSITEVVTGNGRKTRNQLEHVYQFAGVPGGAKTFRVKAYQSPSGDGDNFRFAYLDTTRRKAKWVTMLTVTKTSDNGQYQTFALKSALSGTVSIRVTDTNNTRGASGLDTIFIDHMLITTP